MFKVKSLETGCIYIVYAVFADTGTKLLIFDNGWKKVNANLYIPIIPNEG